MSNKITLPRAFRAKWLKALRSGRYRQTQKVLADEQGYCCLGIGARVCGIPKDKLLGYAFITQLANDETIDPRSTLAKALKWDADVYSRYDSNSRERFVSKLAELNDEGKPFGVIADYIEANTRAI